MAERIGGGGDSRLELIEVGRRIRRLGAGQRGPVLAVLMTGEADGPALHPQHGVGGFQNLMVAVAGGTTGQPHLFEPVLHASGGEELADLPVAGAGKRWPRCPPAAARRGA